MLELKNVSFEIGDSAIPIIKDVSLTLENQKLYVITGPNGSGKSSLAKIIMGIYRPTSGKIYFDGQDITDMGVTERARLGIGFAFQNPPRFKGISVGSLLRIASSSEKAAVGCNYLFDVGLCPKDYVNREVNNSLSGGELKRIEIATLLNRTLKMAIFDEPEAGIDLWSFSKLTETFNKMHEKKDSTIVIISHQERILNLADEIILIADGYIQRKGAKEEMLPDILNACDCNKNCIERMEIGDECN